MPFTIEDPTTHIGQLLQIRELLPLVLRTQATSCLGHPFDDPRCYAGGTRGGKKRPAVVVSSGAYIREHPDIVLMAVTSQQRTSPAIGEVTLTEWKAAGLLKLSFIKPVFTTIEKGLVLRKLGRLAPDDRKALCGALKEILGE